MGTGSHRPQFEAAKGRPDETGGIQHVRALKSHTKLKYRTSFLESNQKAPAIKAIGNGPLADQLPAENTGSPIYDLSKEEKLHTLDDSKGNAQSSCNEKSSSFSQEESSDESEDELIIMQRELQRLKQREQLRAQKESKTKKSVETASSKWRAESVFKKTSKRPKKDSFVDKFMR